MCMVNFCNNNKTLCTSFWCIKFAKDNQLFHDCRLTLIHRQKSSDSALTFILCKKNMSKISRQYLKSKLVKIPICQNSLNSYFKTSLNPWHNNKSDPTVCHRNPVAENVQAESSGFCQVVLFSPDQSVIWCGSMFYTYTYCVTRRD